MGRLKEQMADSLLLKLLLLLLLVSELTSGLATATSWTRAGSASVNVRDDVKMLESLQTVIKIIL